MDERTQAIVAYGFLGLLVVMAALIVWMFVSLVRSEIGASTWAFIATMGATLVETIEVAVAQPNGEPVEPFVRLVVAAMAYAIFLGWFKHKYGG